MKRKKMERLSLRLALSAIGYLHDELCFAAFPSPSLYRLCCHLVVLGTLLVVFLLTRHFFEYPIWSVQVLVFEFVRVLVGALFAPKISISCIVVFGMLAFLLRTALVPELVGFLFGSDVFFLLPTPLDL
jgi:hypothetical protein